MLLRRYLSLGLAIFLTGCFFASREPLFGPDDFVSLPFNGNEFKGKDGWIQIRQYGTASRTYGLTMVERTEGDAPDISFYRGGFVPLGPNLYLAQVITFAMDGPDETQFFASKVPIAPKDYDPEGDNAIGDDNEPYAYIFMETETAPMPEWASESPTDGVQAIKLYVTLKSGSYDAIATIAEKHDVRLADGFIPPSPDDLSPNELKAFFLEVFETQKGSFSDPQRFELEADEE